MARYELKIEYQGEAATYKAIVRAAYLPSEAWGIPLERLEIVTLEAIDDDDARAQIQVMVQARCGADRRKIAGMGESIADARIVEPRRSTDDVPPNKETPTMGVMKRLSSTKATKAPKRIKRIKNNLGMEEASLTPSMSVVSTPPTDDVEARGLAAIEAVANQSVNQMNAKGDVTDATQGEANARTKASKKAGHEHYCPVHKARWLHTTRCSNRQTMTRMCPECEAKNQTVGEVLAPPADTALTPLKTRPVAAVNATKTPATLPAVPPVLDWPAEQPCHVPGCPRLEEIHGLCTLCLRAAQGLIAQGLTTWATMEAAGRVRPLRPLPTLNLPHRKAWLLGEWTPAVPETVPETVIAPRPNAPKGKPTAGKKATKAAGKTA
jgi:hypothetical protein